MHAAVNLFQYNCRMLNSFLVCVIFCKIRYHNLKHISELVGNEKVYDPFFPTW